MDLGSESIEGNLVDSVFKMRVGSWQERLEDVLLDWSIVDRVADAEAQAVKLVGMEAVDNGLNTVVAGGIAAKLDLVLPYSDIKVVVDDVEFGRGNFVVGEELGDGQAGLVHIGSGDGKVKGALVVKAGLEKAFFLKF